MYSIKLPLKAVKGMYYGAGKTQHEVARALGVSQKVVWRFMKHNRLKARKPAPCDQRATRNNAWKGDKAGYAAFHKRVEAARGRPRRCVVCGESRLNVRYEWANMTGAYEDPFDYKRMCVTCHKGFDRARRERMEA